MNAASISPLDAKALENGRCAPTCPVCGAKMIQAFDRPVMLCFECGSCGFLAGMPERCAEELKAAFGALDAKGYSITVKTVQRSSGEAMADQSPMNQAIITTDGPIMEALVDLDKIEEMIPGASPLGSLEDRLRLALTVPPPNDGR